MNLVVGMGAKWTASGTVVGRCNRMTGPPPGILESALDSILMEGGDLMFLVLVGLLDLGLGVFLKEGD